MATKMIRGKGQTLNTVQAIDIVYSLWKVGIVVLNLIANHGGATEVTATDYLLETT